MLKGLGTQRLVFFILYKEGSTATVGELLVAQLLFIAGC